MENKTDNNVTDISDKAKSEDIKVELNEAERFALHGLSQQIKSMQKQMGAMCVNIAESRGIAVDGEIGWQTDPEIKILTGTKNKA